MKRLPAVSTAIVLLLLVPCTARQQQQQPPSPQSIDARVDEYVKAEIEKQRIPGLSLAVVRDGQVILARGYGLANVEHQVPVKPETIFQSGSVGKQFTATAVMMLVEEGRVNLDDKLNKYFADAPDIWKNITIRHLLTHTAGTTDYPSDFDFRRDYTEDELVKRAALIPLAFQPGENWSYSNMGYVLLGILIGKVTGKFYGDFLQERIFKPLGMTTARIISESDIVPNRAAGYRLVKGELKNQEWVSPMMNTTADGSLYLTVLDMAKWDAALYTEKLLKRASLDLMWTPVKLAGGGTRPYGFGWSLVEVRGHRLIEHGGAWQGFKSHIARYVNDKLTVVVFANLAQANVEKVAHGVAAIYNQELAPPPAQATADNEPEVTALLREVLQKTVEGTLARELFTTDAQAVIFPDAARRAGEFLKTLGPLTSVTLVERKEEGGLRAYRYRLVFKDATLFCLLSLTKENKIADIDLRPE
ncbi:MAG TPA: serine hydrolase domain-containing protein [Pyrinomonadaceae bacterium]|nr:serine hydrolase domain-containing protein [Pyrinomonadaceae bacterium]